MTTSLTTRERDVLHGISQGYTTKEIASQLYLSDHTIISYRKSLLSKLQAMNAPAMVRKGFELGILTTNG
ncbi:MAG: helix-turn-helix transcriptional regulator [Bacteroidota bacterium]